MSETMTADTYDIERINEMLKELSPETVSSVVAFVAYQADRERRHKVFVEETLAAEQEFMLTFNSAQEAFDAIFSEV